LKLIRGALGTPQALPRPFVQLAGYWKSLAVHQYIRFAMLRMDIMIYCYM